MKMLDTFGRCLFFFYFFVSKNQKQNKKQSTIEQIRLNYTRLMKNVKIGSCVFVFCSVGLKNRDKTLNEEHTCFGCVYYRNICSGGRSTASGASPIGNCKNQNQKTQCKANSRSKFHKTQIQLRNTDTW